LAELLENFGIETIEIYIGVLFDTGDKPATVQSDKTNGFYSSSKEGFKYLRDMIKQSSTIKIINEDTENLQMELSLTYSKLKVRVGALYGNDITLKLFRKNFPVSELLLLKYDDMWLSQLITIDERAVLLKYQKNFTKIFIDLLDRDRTLRQKYNYLINSECQEEELSDTVNYLLENYTDLFDDKLVPARKIKLSI